MDTASLQSVTFSHQGQEQTDVTKALEIKNDRGVRFMRLETKQHLMLAG